MGWLIAGLAGLVLLGGLLLLGVVVLLGGVALLARRWRRHREPADDMLIVELLARPDAGAVPAPAAREAGAPAPAPAVTVREDDWLETQLASATAWSRRMQEQITSTDWPRPFYTGESGYASESSHRPGGDRPGVTWDPADGSSASTQESPEPAPAAQIGVADAPAAA